MKKRIINYFTLLLPIIIIALSVFFGVKEIYINLFKYKDLYYQFVFIILVVTIIIAYKHSKEKKDQYFFSPIINSLLYLWLTIVLFRILLMFCMNHAGNYYVGLFSLMISIIISTIISFLIMRIILVKQDLNNYEGHENKWFNCKFYYEWVETLSVFFSIFALLLLFQKDDDRNSAVGLIFTIWCGYSVLLLVIKKIMEYIKKSKLIKKE
nr:hypothetical protein [uncultured Acetobacterium sp.]